MAIRSLLITGGTGFIGTRLYQDLAQLGQDITVLTRNPHPKLAMKQVTDLAGLENQFDMIINLAGEPLNKRRWNNSIKQAIYDSRIKTTQKILDYIQKSDKKPELFISGSAIGYYEEPNSFSHKLCADWEAEASKAKKYGIRVCLMRTGIVLGKNGGALGGMLLPFKLGLGAQLGNGQQWMSWIHMDEMVRIIKFIMGHTELSGPINFTAPNPVRHKDFVKILARVLKRPCFLKFPEFLVQFLFGEMGKELLLTGQKVLPEKILKAGYEFKYPELEHALKNILG